MGHEKQCLYFLFNVPLVKAMNRQTDNELSYIKQWKRRRHNISVCDFATMKSEYQYFGKFVTGDGNQQTGSGQLRQHDGQGHSDHLGAGRQRQ